MNKLFYSLLLLVFNVTTTKAQYFTNISEIPRSFDIQADHSNNIYVSGGFFDAGIFGGVPVAVQEVSRKSIGYLAKYNQTGNIAFVKLMHSLDGGVSAGKIVVDGNNDIYVTGGFFGSLYIDGHFIADHPRYLPTIDFIAKFDSLGSLLWAKDFDFDFGTNSRPFDLSVGPSGNLYVSGNLGSKGYAAIIDKSGHFKGYINTPGVVFSIPPIVYVDNQEYLYVIEPESSGENHPFTMIKVDSTGQLIWKNDSIRGEARSATLTGLSNQELILSMTVLDKSPFTFNDGKSIASPGLNLVKLDANTGALVSNVLISPNLNIIPDVFTDDNEHIYFSGTYRYNNGIPVSLGTVNDIDTTFNGNRGSRGFVAKFEPNGQLLWASLMMPEPNHIQSFFLNTTITPSQKIYISAFSPTKKVRVNNQVVESSFIGHPQDDSFGFIATLSERINNVTGVFYYDYDTNNLPSINEYYSLPARVQVNPFTNIRYASHFAQFSIGLDTGTYSLIPQVPKYHLCTPTSYQVELPNYQFRDNRYDFKLSAIPNIRDVEIFFSSTGRFRPGMSTNVNIVCQNNGTDTVSGLIKALLDSTIELNKSTPSITSKNGDTLIWAFDDLKIAAQEKIQLEVKVPVGILLGTELISQTWVEFPEKDSIPEDNQDTLREIVTGSFDPNDKQVFNGDSLTPQEVADSPWLTYKIRFQNTGTDTAFLVRIEDVMDEGLDLSSLETLSASHAYSWEVDGNRTVNWIFDNILLPDSNVDEPGSHGFVTYRIRMKPNLMDGDSVTNTAGIYFDFNAPIITNTVVTRVVEPVSTGMQEIPSKLQLLVYPNPSDGTFRVRVPEATTLNLELMDLAGRVVWGDKAFISGEQVQTNALAPGVYLLKVQAKEKQGFKKLIIQ